MDFFNQPIYYSGPIFHAKFKDQEKTIYTILVPKLAQQPRY